MHVTQLSTITLGLTWPDSISQNRSLLQSLVNVKETSSEWVKECSFSIVFFYQQENMHSRSKHQFLQVISLYLQPMREQNQKLGCTFVIEKASQKGPFYLQPNQRVASLQNKVTFYEGQLDPLHLENQSSKQHFLNLSRIVSTSTEILRNLLPVSNNPAKKLKLEMSSIDEIAKMIEQDWKDMEQLIVSLQEEKNQMRKEIKNWKDKLKDQQNLRQREVRQLLESKQQMKHQFQEQIKLLNKDIEKIRHQLEGYKQQAQKEQALRDSLIQSSNRELELFKQEARCKYNDYERCIARLTAQMEANLLEFQEGKKMVKSICEKMMNDKLADLAESYEMMLKIKEEEKYLLNLSITEITQNLKKEISERQEQIQALTIQNDAKKDQIKNLEDQLYKKKEELMRELKEIKDLQNQLLKINQKNDILKDKVSRQERTIQEKDDKMKQTIESYEKDIKMMKEKGNEAINQILEEKMRLEKKIIQQEDELQEVKKSLETIVEQWKQKTENAEKQWQQRQVELQAESLRIQKSLQQEKEKVKRVKEQRQRDLEDFKRQQFQLQKTLQRQFQQSKQEYMRQQQARINRLIEENNQQIVRLKVSHRKEIELEQEKISRQIKKIKGQYEKMFEQNQIRYKEERRKLQEQIVIERKKGEVLLQKLNQANQMIAEATHKMQALKLQQQLALKKLEQQNEENIKKYEKMMETQMNEFLKQLEIKESKLHNLQQRLQEQRKQYQKKLTNKSAEVQAMKQSQQKQITFLKNNNGIQEVENKYQSQLKLLNEQHQSQLKLLTESLNAKLKEAQLNYINQINNLKETNQRQIQNIISTYDKKMLENHQGFQRSLINLASFYEHKNTFFNQKQIGRQIQKQLVNQTQQEKIEFIQAKMQENARLIQVKDGEILLLEQKLERFEKQMEEQLMQRRVQLERQLNNKISQCNNKISIKEQQCKDRVKTVENQRISFSQEMFREFNQMKEHHRNQYESLERKYKELESLLSDRPSRVEDVTKIKELINIQTKLDQEITIYHKKMETANEIVKYLNLQLENYKETYDIFKPNEVPFNNAFNNNKTISFAGQSQHMIDYYKAKEERSKEERNLQTIERRLSVESPDIKEFRVFMEKEEEHEQSLIIQSKQAKISRSRKYSFVPDKLPPTRDRFKTEKMIQKESQLMNHAETFMKLIKGTSQQDNSLIRQLETIEDSKKKTYRRRKLKRLATGVQHYF